MLGSHRYQDRQQNYQGASSSYQQQNRQRQKSGQRQHDRGDSQSIFEGIKVAFLTGGSRSGGQQEDQQLIRDFRDNGGRVLDLNKLTRDNYRDALKSLDYLIVGSNDTKLDSNTLGRFSQQLGVPRQEFQNMLRRAQERGQGFQVLSPNWIHDCLDENNYQDPGQYQIRMKSGSGDNENYYDNDDDDDQGGDIEDTAYTNKHRSRTGGQSSNRSGQHIGHSKYTEGINYDELREEDLDPDNEEDQMILTQLRKSKALRRVGTSSPYRNKDGSIDKRRVRDAKDHTQGAHFDDFEDEQEFDEDTDRGVKYYDRGGQQQRRQGQSQRSGGYSQGRNQSQGRQQSQGRNQGQSQGRSQGQSQGRSQGRSQGQSQGYSQGDSQRRNIGSSGQGLRKGEATFVQEDVSNLNPEDFPPEFRNKDGTLDRRRFRHSKVKDMMDKGQDPSSLRFPNQKYDSGRHEMQKSSAGDRARSQARGRSQGNRGQSDQNEDDYEPMQYQQKRQGGRSQSNRGGSSYQSGKQSSSRYQRYSSRTGGKQTQGGGRKIDPDYTEDGLRRNMDGTIDLRQFGPFNVERAPTGQLVPKGTVDNPINKYADSKTKYRQAHIPREEYEQRTKSGQYRQRRSEDQNDDDDENDDDYENDEDNDQQRSGRQGQRRYDLRSNDQQKQRSSSIRGQQQQQQRRQGSRQQNNDQDDGDDDEHEREKEEAYEQDHDRRHLGPFNVDRAPTGQFVPKGSVKNPINRYKDSKQKGGMGLSTYPGGTAGQSRRQTQDYDDQEDTYDEDENNQDQRQQQRGSRQGQQRSSQRNGGSQQRSGSQSNQQRNQSRQQQNRGQDEGDDDEHEREKEEAYEQDHDRRHLGPFNVDRAPTGQFVPKGSIKNPINRYKDSKEKGGMGLSTAPGGTAGQSRRQTRDNDDDQDDDQDDDNQQQQNRSNRRQGQKRSYEDMNNSNQGRQGSRNNRRQGNSQDDDNQQDDDQENLESHQQDNRNRSRQVPRGLMQTHENQKDQNLKKQPLNQQIIQQLETIRDHYNDVNDQGRKIAYNKAIGELRNLSEPIESIDDLDDVQNIGQNIKDHIREFIETGTIEGFDNKSSGKNHNQGNSSDNQSQQQQQQQQQVDDSQEV